MVVALLSRIHVDGPRCFDPIHVVSFRSRNVSVVYDAVVAVNGNCFPANPLG